MVASLVRLAAAWEGLTNIEASDRSIWRMWRGWDEAE